MKKNIIRIIVSAVFALIFAIIFTVGISAQRMQQRFDSEIYGNLVRLHILADSDSEYDQEAKLKIRDKVTEHIADMVSSCTDVSQASEIIASNMENIRKYVQGASDGLGYDYEITLDFGEEYYPVRYYDGFCFPAGKYKSLRIKLGSGQGKNWWCVLYPTVCTAMASDVPDMLEDAGISEETVDIVCEDNNKYRLEFFLLELLGIQK